MHPTFLEPHWLELERSLHFNSQTIDYNFLPALQLPEDIVPLMFGEINREKDKIEVEQIIARLMHKPCFTEAADSPQMTLKKKCRLLALYHLGRKEYWLFGQVVIKSIIREWPVTISYAEEGNKPYTWDRAPLSLAMKDKPNIRKAGDKYVMRVLALEDNDIGTLLTSAEVKSTLLEIDEDGNECVTDAYIVELNREGGANKRDAPSADSVSSKKARQSKSKVQENRMQEQKHFCKFDHLQSFDGYLAFVPAERRGDFVDEKSENVAFTINNIAIFDPTIRSAITQKYLIKSHFEFLFNQSFIVKTVDVIDQQCDGLYQYKIDVKSMWFEASTNASTHWQKSMPAIWDILHEYYRRSGELTQEELSSGGQVLNWGHVMDMVANFISCNSDFHVRPLTISEIRTVSRMIISHHIVDFNREKGEQWMMNDLTPEEEMKTAHILSLSAKQISDLKRDVANGKTFTQALYSQLELITLQETVAIKRSEFTEPMMDLSRRTPVKTASVYSWLHGVSEMITGEFLHRNPKKTVELFNRELITVRSKESAERAIEKISHHFLSKRMPAKILMIRFDERDQSNLLFDFINPTNVNQRQRRQFGTVNAKSIKDAKVPLSPMVKSAHIKKAIEDGVVSKKDHKMCGLYAALKTGYLNGFDTLAVVMQNDSSEIKLWSLFNSVDKRTPQVYSYDLTPLEMEEGEINPFIGPIDHSEVTTARDETISFAPTVTQFAKLRISTPSTVSTTSASPNSRAKKVVRKKKTGTSSPSSDEPQQQQSPVAQPGQRRRVKKPVQQIQEEPHLPHPSTMHPIQQTSHYPTHHSQFPHPQSMHLESVAYHPMDQGMHRASGMPQKTQQMPQQTMHMPPVYQQQTQFGQEAVYPQHMQPPQELVQQMMQPGPLQPLQQAPLMQQQMLQQAAPVQHFTINNNHYYNQPPPPPDYATVAHSNQSFSQNDPSGLFYESSHDEFDPNFR